MKKISVLLAAIMLVVALAGCSNNSAGDAGDTITKAGGKSAAAKVLNEDDDKITAADKLTKKSNTGSLGYQLDEPVDGEEIAIITVKDFGEIKIRFFSDEAPKTVYSFKKHAKQGYYDGLTFHRIIEDFMIQGGDPLGTGTGGESIWGEAFEDEFQPNLVNISGSVAMANSGQNTNGSQFFINYKTDKNIPWDYFEEGFEYYKEDPENFTNYNGNWIDMDKVTDQYREIYNEHSGSPTLDGFYSTTGKGHTVFAQVFEGLDVVEKIAKTDTDSSDTPIEDVVIEKIEITQYKA